MNIYIYIQYTSKIVSEFKLQNNHDEAAEELLRRFTNKFGLYPEFSRFKEKLEEELLDRHAKKQQYNINKRNSNARKKVIQYSTMNYTKVNGDITLHSLKLSQMEAFVGSHSS